jgi:hypothetical protein
MDAERHRFKIGELLLTEIKVFRTQQPNRLAVDFAITMRFLVDSSVVVDGRTDCRMVARGSCYHDPEVNSILDEFLWSITYEWNYPFGGTGRMIQGFKSEDPSLPFPPPFNSESDAADDI